MDIKLETKFNLYDKVGFVCYYEDTEYGYGRHVEHYRKGLAGGGVRGFKRKELYGEIVEIKLTYTARYDEYENLKRTYMDWNYVVKVDGSEGGHFEVLEDEIFSRNVQELSAYSIEELQEEISKRSSNKEEEQ